MSASDGNAETCDLGDYLFPVTLQDAATVTQQLIHAQLAEGIALLDHRQPSAVATATATATAQL